MNIFIRMQITIAVMLLSLAAINCGGGAAQVKEENPQPKERTFGLEEANSSLQSLTYSPYGKGFEYKTTEVPTEDFNSWFAQFSPQINQAISAIGPGFILQVTGHTCSRGPRDAQPEVDKLGNIHYSLARAQNVYDALIKAGIPKESMTVVGIADDETLPGLETNDQMNRRVTFKIVPVPAK